MKALARACFSCVLAVCAIAACSPEDILLGTRVTPDAGTPAPTATSTEMPPEMTPDAASDGERECRNFTECDAGEYCSREKCTSPHGTCKPLPTVCDDDRDPVCGCDGITYWNDCLRRVKGISSHTDGPCDGNDMPVVRCGGMLNVMCPDDTYCSKRNNAECTSVPVGFCWYLPTDCDDQANESNRWRRCGNTSGECLGLCAAIKFEQPYYPYNRCTQ